MTKLFHATTVCEKLSVVAWKILIHSTRIKVQSKNVPAVL